MHRDPKTQDLAPVPNPITITAEHRVYRGAASKILPKLPTVDVLLTDPPYVEHVFAHQAGTIVKGRRADLEFEHLTREAMTALLMFARERVRRWVLIFCDDRGALQWRQAGELLGLEFVRTCYWHKRGAAPQFTGDRPGTHVEQILAFHARGTKKRWNGRGRGNVFVHPIVRGKGRAHPTEKPLSLLVELVGLFSDPSEIILDPFCGSGTTLLAAKMSGRRSIGADKKKQWAEHSKRRLDT
jgi:site-specific DNA-methyltransferase (adenine-specific)